MIYPELFGDTVLSEADIQARTQSVVEREWPAWKRERAMREQGAELTALNGFFVDLAVEVDDARAHHTALAATIAQQQAEAAAAEEAARLAAIEAGYPQ